jgi:hypothetical protein
VKRSLLLASVVVACGSAPPPPPPVAGSSLAGRWNLASRTCEGHRIVVPSLEGHLDLDGNGGTWTMAVPGCRTLQRDLHIVNASTGRLLATDPMGSVCTPDPCAVAVAATIDERPGRSTFECPGRTAHEYTLTVEAQSLTLYTTDDNCTLRFARGR